MKTRLFWRKLYQRIEWCEASCAIVTYLINDYYKYRVGNELKIQYEKRLTIDLWFTILQFRWLSPRVIIEEDDLWITPSTVNE